MSTRRLKVSLTGGIASGKSQVSRLFAAIGITIIDTDQIARSLFTRDSPHLAHLKQQFGSDIFYANGELDRKSLGKIVFSNPGLLTWLNQFTHPLIAEQIDKQLQRATSPYVILDIPLLINKDGKIPAHLKRVTNRVLVVDLNEPTQLTRLCQRDNIDQQAAQQIIDTQSSRQQKLALADDVIDNNGTILALEPQVNSLHNHYIKLATTKD